MDVLMCLIDVTDVLLLYIRLFFSVLSSSRLFEREVCILPILVWGDVLPPIICLSLSSIRDRHSLLVDVV